MDKLRDKKREVRHQKNTMSINDQPISNLYRRISKYLVVSLLLVIFCLVPVSPVLAKKITDPMPLSPNWTEPPLSEFQERVESEVLEGETHLHWSINTLINSVLTLILGREQKSGESESVGDDTYRPGGALGGVTNLIAAMYANPPASGVDYLAYLGGKVGIVSPVYAQGGVGFGGLRPILPIWKAFRDIAYIFFVIIFIATGFAIMFRMKISPQAVMTIQSAIPRVVIALILVTFSYAIAGFLIDLIYVMIALVIIAFGAADIMGAGWVQQAQSVYFKATPLTLLGEFMTRGVAMAERVGDILAPESFFPDTVSNIVEWLTRTVPGLQVLRAPSNLLILILTIVLFFTFFKVFFALLSAYVRILISIIFGPLQLMLGVLPGQDSFFAWLRGILSNLLVFPATIAMFLLADVILVATEKSGNLWAPPLLQTGGLSLKGNVLGGLIAYGILLMTPKVVEMVQQALQVKPPPYGTAIGEAMGPAVVVGKYGGIAGVEYGYERGVGGFLATKWPGVFGTGRPLRQALGVGKEAVQKRLGS